MRIYYTGGMSTAESSALQVSITSRIDPSDSNLHFRRPPHSTTINDYTTAHTSSYRVWGVMNYCGLPKHPGLEGSEGGQAGVFRCGFLK